MLFTHGRRNPLEEAFLESELDRLDRDLHTGGFEGLPAVDRYVAARALSELSMDVVEEVSSLDPQLRAAIAKLEAVGRRTYARVSAVLLGPAVASGAIYSVDRSPLPDGPAAIFVPNVGGQYPVRGGTVGNRSRRVLGIQPPIGSFYVASWLALLGVEVRAFNLELGDSEFEACDQALDELGERVQFLFSTSNFFSQVEIESMYLLADKCRSHEKDGYVPRLVGAGYSSYFCRREYLEYTPVDVVVGPHGEPSEADMIFSSPYTGPRDTRTSLELFSDIPNLHLPVRGPEGFSVHDTPVVKLTENERRVFSGALDVRLMELDKKYWDPTNIMDVCAPDDLNIPLELAELPQLSHEAPAGQAPRSRTSLSLSNYVHRPNSIKMMTVFGSCPRACQFCQLTQWGEGLYFYSGLEAVTAMNEAAAVYPDLQMYIFEDDDFLLRRSHVHDLIEALRKNKQTDGKIFYVSTVPMEVDAEIMFDLREVGFRAMLLGLESPVERVARQIGKFAARYDFDHVLEAPKIGHDAGLHIRVTAIPFYPLVREEDLAGVIDGLLDFLTYGTGISVAVHPLVKAAPGIELTKSGTHEVTTMQYQLPDESGREIELLRYVMPDDAVVREVALAAIRETAGHLERRLAPMELGEQDHPSSFGVLALFSATVEAWRRAEGRTVGDEVLDGLDRRLDAAFEQMTRKHEVLSALQRVILADADPAGLASLVNPGNLPYLQLGLRMAADFGPPREVAAAARIAVYLESFGHQDWRVQQSIRYACRRPMPADVESELRAVVAGLGETQRPAVADQAPKLLRLSPR